MKRHVSRLILLLGVAGWLSDRTAAIGQERTVAGEEKVETLVMLAIHMEANYRGIGTWSGVYDLSERLYTANRRSADGTDTGPAWQVSEVVVAYTIDAKTDRVRSDFVKEEPSKLVDRETGEDIPVNFQPREYRTIRTPEHLLHLPTRDLRGQVITRVVYRRNSRMAKANQFHVNPLNFFGDGHLRFAEVCSIYAKWLLDENSLTRRKNTTTLVQRQVDGVTEYSLTIRRPSDDGGVDRHVRTIVFSSAAGFNPLTYNLISFGRREVEISWEYRKDGGVYLPSRHEIRRYNWANLRDNEPQDADANLVSHRIFKLRESSLNQPVDSEAFELAGLALEYGDRLADEIERQLQVYDARSSSPPRNSSWIQARCPIGESFRCPRARRCRCRNSSRQDRETSDDPNVRCWFSSSARGRRA